MQRIGVTIEKVRAAALSVDIRDGTQSQQTYASLWANTGAAAAAAAEWGNLTIQQYFRDHPGTTATSEMNGNSVFIRPNVIDVTDFGGNAALMMHEVLHNLGFGDSEIQTALGIPDDPKNTHNITFALFVDCFTY